MADFLLVGGRVLCSGLTGACIMCLLWLISEYWKVVRVESDDTWRDLAPWLIRVNSLMCPELVRVIGTRLPERTLKISLQRLQEAGLQYAITPAELIAARLSCVLIAIAISTLLLSVVRPFDIRLLSFLNGLLLLAWFYPAIWLRDVSVRRKRAIEKDFPFFSMLWC